jgi:hypothetical protein
MSDHIAIVGSSDKLIGSGFGKEIDSFTDVIRFNRAPTDGYEVDVGSKTTLRWLVTAAVCCLRSPAFDGDRMFAATLRDTRICHTALPADLRAHQFVHKSNKLFYFNYARMARGIGIANKWPKMTSGLCVAHILMRVGVVPHLFGFDVEKVELSDPDANWPLLYQYQPDTKSQYPPWQVAKKVPRKHYWSAEEISLPPGHHVFLSEGRILYRLAALGKIVLHGG